jgi:predicted ATPase
MSTLLEGIAVLVGYDEAGGGKGLYAGRSFQCAGSNGRKSFQGAPRELAAQDHQWLFFRAESFFSVARYLDEVARESPGGSGPPDFLSHSHGEGFMRFFEERCRRQGIFIFDEPESALSPARQIEFLKLLQRMENSKICQVVMATHSPMLMAYPTARLLRLTKYALEPVTVEQTDHFRLMREFCLDPTGFVEGAIAGA